MKAIKLIFCLLLLSITTLTAMAQEYAEKPKIKILNFEQVHNIHYNLAEEFAFRTPHTNRDSLTWALLIVETNDPNIRVVSSEEIGHYIQERFRENPRLDINKYRLPGQKWYSMRPGARQFRITHDRFRHDVELPKLFNSEGKHIGRIEKNWFIPVSSIFGSTRQAEACTVYRLTIEVPQDYRGSVELVKPKRKAGYAVFRSEPEGAEIYVTIDGKEEYIGDCTPDATTKRLQYGTYSFRAIKNMYHPLEGTVTIDSTKVFKSIKLRPNFGKIKITTTPAGAQVRINNHPKTYITPCETDNITSGNYTLKLILDGHELIQRNVTVVDGETIELNESFNPQYAQVTIKTIPGAKISINGVVKGTTSFSGKLNYDIYDIEVTKDGYEKASRQIEINSSTSQEITLTPRPIYGMVEISTQPSGARITIDGKDYGTSPNYIDTMLIGPHSVKISLDGYDDIVRNITIAKDQEVKITEKLNKKVAPKADPVINPIVPEKQIVTNGTKTLTPRWADGVTDEQKRILTELINSMVYVEGGTFIMGATSEQGSDAYDDEKPPHRVTLSDYHIGKYEVTQEEWQAVMGNNPSNYKGNKKPVEKVSWNDCQEFIRKLNTLTGLNFMLPTEAQWEYAARGGNKSMGYKYSGSNKIKNVAYYNKGNGGPIEVGQKQPNELGLYDMNGNVWEWCSDAWYNYDSSNTTDPKHKSGNNRVLRGGSWRDNARYCRVSFRIYYYPYFPYLSGLRLAVNIENNVASKRKEVTQTTIIPNWSSSATSEQKRILGALIYNMVAVKGGTFNMGAQKSNRNGANYDSEIWDDESSVHRVTLSDYHIGKYEVTQEEWQAVMGNNPSYYKGSKKPVERVSWNDCQEFIRRLNALTDLNFSLPTEAQWEYASRGGNMSKGYKYSGSNTIDNVAWYSSNSGSETHPVGQKQPNELGLYDMSGNVYEWCSDALYSYDSNSAKNPKHEGDTGSNRMFRGGGRNFGARYCRVSCRFNSIPDSGDSYLGLRLVINP